MSTGMGKTVYVLKPVLILNTLAILTENISDFLTLPSHSRLPVKKFEVVAEQVYVKVCRQ